MESHHRTDVCAAAGQLEHQRPAEAVADGADPGGVGPGLGEEGVEPGPAHRAEAVEVVVERADPLPHLLPVGIHPCATVLVESERDVAQLGETLRPAALVLVEAVGLGDVRGVLHVSRRDHSAEDSRGFSPLDGRRRRVYAKGPISTAGRVPAPSGTASRPTIVVFGCHRVHRWQLRARRERGRP
jgi:hypothetical protein